MNAATITALASSAVGVITAVTALVRVLRHEKSDPAKASK
jgi:hypothetical protein